jgi:hypothetical protein
MHELKKTGDIAELEGLDPEKNYQRIALLIHREGKKVQAGKVDFLTG